MRYRRLCHHKREAAVSMPTRNVVLTERQAKLIEKLVDSGRYQNASEVLREGLRLLERRAAEDDARLALLRKAARAGFDALDRGEFKEFTTPDELRSYLHDLSEKVIARTGE
jgi:antitoxin ParD1/3/4